MLADITEALGRGDTAAALAHARDLLAQEPENAQAQHLLGVCLQRTGDLRGARAAFERAVELGPDMADHRVSLASMQLAAGEREPALRLLAEAVQLNPNLLVAYVLLAQDALANGNIDEAERNLRLAQRIAPSHPQVLVIEGYVLDARGQPDPSLKAFTRAVQAAPKSPTAQLAMGRAYMARAMWPFAEQAFANALANDSAYSYTTVQLLVRARVAQGKEDEAFQAVDEALAKRQGDVALHALRGQMNLDLGRVAQALVDFGTVLDLQPAALPVLETMIPLMVQSGRGAEVLARAEQAVAAAPGNDGAWRLLHQATAATGGDPMAVLARWREALPGSVACLEVNAIHEESRGNFEAALRLADEALARNPELFTSNLIKAREEARTAPEAALSRLQGMLDKATADPVRRVIEHALGTVLDSMGRHAEAAERFRAMLRLPVEQPVPLPNVLPASEGLAGHAGASFLWTITGLDARHLLGTLKSRMGINLATDRIGNLLSPDGFGALRFEPGHPEAGTAERWRQWREAQGLDPAKIVDWMPHVDAQSLAALGGSRWLAVLVDPRDAFLNWMVRGAFQGYAFPSDTGMAAEWLARTLESLADFGEREPGQLVVVRLDQDAAAAGETLEKALGLTEPLPSLVGRDLRFPAGHWRHYQGTFEAEFARLGAVAQRLGYPAA